MTDSFVSRRETGDQGQAGPSSIERFASLPPETQYLSFVICHFIRASGENDGLRYQPITDRE
jgi:hypothetical protein